MTKIVILLDYGWRRRSTHSTTRTPARQSKAHLTLGSWRWRLPARARRQLAASAERGSCGELMELSSGPMLEVTTYGHCERRTESEEVRKEACRGWWQATGGGSVAQARA